MKLMPLHELTILNPRASHQASALTKLLEKHGAKVVEIPLIAFKFPDDKTEMDKVVKAFENYDWIIFTSVNSVRFFLQFLEEKGYSKELLRQVKIAAVGEKTARFIEDAGFSVQTFPSVYDAEHLADELVCFVKKEERILYPKSKISRDVLPSVLRENGFVIDDPIFYETVYCDKNKEKLNEMVESKKIDMIIFTSPSTVHSFFSQLKDDFKKQAISSLTFAVIGRVTAKALASYGDADMIVPQVYTSEGLVEEIVRTYKR